MYPGGMAGQAGLLLQQEEILKTLREIQRTLRSINGNMDLMIRVMLADLTPQKREIYQKWREDMIKAHPDITQPWTS